MLLIVLLKADRTLDSQKISSKRIENQLKSVRMYDDFELQDKARNEIPVERLHKEANERVETESSRNFHEELLKCLLKWFKAEVHFFLFDRHPMVKSLKLRTVISTSNGSTH